MASTILADRPSLSTPRNGDVCRSPFEREVWDQLLDLVKRPLTQDERVLLAAAAVMTRHQG